MAGSKKSVYRLLIDKWVKNYLTRVIYQSQVDKGSKFKGGVGVPHPLEAKAITTSSPHTITQLTRGKVVGQVERESVYIQNGIVDGVLTSVIGVFFICTAEFLDLVL